MAELILTALNSANRRNPRAVSCAPHCQLSGCVAFETPRRWLMPSRSVRSHRRVNFLVVWRVCLVCCMLWQDENLLFPWHGPSFTCSLLVAAHDSRSSIIRCRVMSINWCSSSFVVPEISALCRVITVVQTRLASRIGNSARADQFRLCLCGYQCYPGYVYYVYRISSIAHTRARTKGPHAAEFFCIG